MPMFPSPNEKNRMPKQVRAYLLDIQEYEGPTECLTP